jgi:hypothetical protein
MTDERPEEPLEERIFRGFADVLPLARDGIPQAAAAVWLGCVANIFDPKLSQDSKLRDPAELAHLQIPDEFKRLFTASDPLTWPRSVPYVTAARRITAQLHEMTEGDLVQLINGTRVIFAIIAGCEWQLRSAIESGVDERPFNLFRDVMSRLFDFPRFKEEKMDRRAVRIPKTSYGARFDDRIAKIVWFRKPPESSGDFVFFE